MVPTLPGSLPSWVTPRRLVFVAQLVGLSFLVALAGSWGSLALSTALLLWMSVSLLFFLLAQLTGGQSSWLAVAASYGEIGAWLGSLTSASCFVCFFMSDARPHQTATFFFAVICTMILGWLPGLLAGLFASLFFWVMGGWLLASLHQHKTFPAHDDVHQLLFRVGGWFGVLGLGGLCWAPSFLLWGVGLGLALLGFGLGLASFLGLHRRALWLETVRAGRLSGWELRPLEALSSPLLPLSNRDSQGLILIRRVGGSAPYRDQGEERPVALC